jgi:hypothetical protein
VCSIVDFAYDALLLLTRLLSNKLIQSVVRGATDRESLIRALSAFASLLTLDEIDEEGVGDG